MSCRELFFSLDDLCNHIFLFIDVEMKPVTLSVNQC